MVEAHIEVKDLSVSYLSGGPGTNAPAISGVSFSVARGEFFCIIGPSGCGKTTLLHAIAGFISERSGDIRVGGRSVLHPKKECAMIFQENALFPWRSVAANIRYPLELSGCGHRDCNAIVEYYLELVGLTQCKDLYPAQLSGGMKQKVQLARALAADSKVILMDEPFGALDAISAEQLEAELLRIWKRAGKTILLVTHNVESAVRLADRVAIMNPGRLKAIVDVALPRPRPSSSPEVILLAQRLREELGLYCEPGLLALASGEPRQRRVRASRWNPNR